MQSVKLNLIPGAVLPVVNVSQYDVKRTFALAVYDGAASYDLTGKTVTIRGTKPDNHGFDYGTSDGVISVSGNTVTVSTTQQMTAVGGQVMAELRIESGTTIIGTLNFIIDVEPSALSDDTILSDTEIPVIERNFEAALAEAEADALVAEGYAKGTQEGTPVGAGSPYYQDNAKYYKEEAEAAASGVLEKYPKIVSDYWYIWDVDTNQYVNTGVRAKGTQGDPGQGVPAGGTTGQVLKKKSNSDYDCEWGTGGGGGASALDDLTDVNITSPASGQGLLYDGAEWVNADVVDPDELTAELRDAEVIEGKNLINKYKVPDLVVSDAKAIATDTGIRVKNDVSGGWSRVGYYYKVKKNTQYVFYSNITITSGKSSVWIRATADGETFVNLFDLVNRSGEVGGRFNTGDYDTIVFWLYCTRDSGGFNGDVTYNNLMVCTSEEWDKSHEYKPYYEPLKDRKLDIVDQQVLGAWNLLKNNATSQVINGVTATINADLSITLNGTVGSNVDQYGYSYVDINTDLSFLEIGKTYYLSGCPFGGSADTYYLQLNKTSPSIADFGNEAACTVASGQTYNKVRINMKQGMTFNNHVFKPMIALKPNMPYVPYVMTNKELTDELSVKTTETTGYPSSATVTKNIVKKSGKMVTVDFAATGFSKSAYGGLFNIPAGYRPSENTSAFIINLSDNTFIPVSIGSDNGSVVTYLEISNKSVAFHVSYMQS